MSHHIAINAYHCLDYHDVPDILGTTRLAVVAMETTMYATTHLMTRSSTPPNMPPWLPQNVPSLVPTYTFYPADILLLSLYCCLSVALNVSVVLPKQHLMEASAASLPGCALPLVKPSAECLKLINSADYIKNFLPSCCWSVVG